MHGMLLLNEFADGFSYISDLNIYIYICGDFVVVQLAEICLVRLG
jgi:hypothetical protein